MIILFLLLVMQVMTTPVDAGVVRTHLCGGEKKKKKLWHTCPFNHLQVFKTSTNTITCNHPIHSPVSFQVADGKELGLEVVEMEDDDYEE